MRNATKSSSSVTYLFLSFKGFKTGKHCQRAVEYYTADIETAVVVELSCGMDWRGRFSVCSWRTHREWRETRLSELHWSISTDAKGFLYVQNDVNRLQITVQRVGVGIRCVRGGWREFHPDQ